MAGSLLLGLLAAGCRPLAPLLTPAHTAAMVEVPAGWFTMGSDSGPPASRPAHSVHLDAFAIDRYEVTHQRFQQYVSASGQLPLAWQQEVPSVAPAVPVTGILWREAQAFCRWYGWRLPTEAEWEKAARGVDGRLYPWGDRWNRDRANTGASGLGGVVAVGSYPRGASPYGALDMVGNAQEWVADHFHPDYYAESPQRDPLGPKQSLDHGLRGGSWASPPERSNTIYRNSSHSARPNDRVGFRCARDLEP